MGKGEYLKYKIEDIISKVNGENLFTKETIILVNAVATKVYI